MTARVQQARTATNNTPPATLLAGQLYLEMGTPIRLWGGTGTPSTPALIFDADASTAALAAKVNKAGDTLTGPLILNADPLVALGAATRQYVDAAKVAAQAASLPLTGGTLTGPLTLNADPGGALGAATKQYVDAAKAAAQAACLPLSGGTLTGPLVLQADPVAALGAATRQYVDGKTWPYLPLAGGTLTGPLILNADPTVALGAVTKQYSDTKLPLAGGTMTGLLILSADPTASLGAVTKHYVDTKTILRLGTNTDAAPAVVDSLTTLAAPALAGVLGAVSPAGDFFRLSARRLAAPAANGSNVDGGQISLFGTGYNVAAMAGGVSIYTGSNAANFKNWDFQNNGVLTLPGGVNFAAWSTGIVTSWSVDGNGIYNLIINNAGDGTLIRSPGVSLGASYIALKWQALSADGTACVVWTASNQAFAWSTTACDRRLKSDVKPATIDALDIINRLPVYEAGVGTGMIGMTPQHWDCTLIADEVGALIPAGFIQGSEQSGATIYDSIRELPLIATLVRAVQQLTARVAVLEGHPA